MMRQDSGSRFTMDIPRAVVGSPRYAFWMSTTEKRLLAVVRSMNCVAEMKRSRSTGRVLVALSEEHDPDEAWHWIRAELEEAIQEVELDPIWINAIRWIL